MNSIPELNFHSDYANWKLILITDVFSQHQTHEAC